MTKKVFTYDDIIIEIDGDDGDRPRGCMWDESVCTSSPEYRIVASGRDYDHSHVELYCPPHYALQLARLAAIHLPECSRKAADHVAAFGPVGE